MAGPRWRGRSWFTGWAAALSAVAIAGGSVALAAHSSSRVGTSPSPFNPATTVRLHARSSAPAAVNLAGTVSWIDQPVDPATAIPSPAPTPPRASDARPCAAADVSAGWGARVGGASQTAAAQVRFVNRSSTPCVLKGYPHIVASEPGRPDVVATDGSQYQFTDTANMAPGQSTVLTLETDVACVARPTGGGSADVYNHVSITLPGGGTVSLDRAFDVTCGLHETTFMVPPPPEPPAPDPYSGLRASLEVPSSVRAGAVLTYVVDLTNSSNQTLSLDPCPSYIESGYELSPVETLPPVKPGLVQTGRVPVGPVKLAYALNCPAPGYINAGDTVRFAMQLAVPATEPPGTFHLFWSLIAVPGATAASTVDVTT